ncbi:MAG: lipoyl(octanoyl) transferase LipB [Gammaproteobacteria bacterium]|nr:lipoyl(octanoyl) transferase LipB [Gammaproteobacteria bacterium]
MPAALVRHLGSVAYEPTLERMRAFTEQREAHTPDEIWLLEHPPVFTLGTNADASHVLAAGDIPVVPVDRGGQVTYHGPGQLVIYVLLDLRRLRLGVRDLVCRLEQSVIGLLAGYDISASGREGAPGVYVGDAKVASVGLRIRRNCSYHGLALNVDPVLEHFARINPCGYPGLDVTSLQQLGVEDAPAVIAGKLLAELSGRLGLQVQDAAA